MQSGANRGNCGMAQFFPKSPENAPQSQKLENHSSGVDPFTCEIIFLRR